jgi:DNA-binding beta-propeller fold protein YncE
MGAGAVHDSSVLKFTATGKFLMQIGKPFAGTGSDDLENFKLPAKTLVDPKTNELYVADGYGNQRVIVFDASSGAFKRMWGAFGGDPTAAGNAAPPAAESEPATAPQFGLVHAVKVSDDGIVYVADRGNQRIQWFTTDGEFISQLVIEGDAPPAPAGFAFSPDPQQQFLYVIESANARLLVFDRQSMTQVDAFGSRSAEPGGMDIAHHIAVDGEGNLYTAEIVNNRRAQKFVAR